MIDGARPVTHWTSSQLHDRTCRRTSLSEHWCSLINEVNAASERPIHLSLSLPLSPSLFLSPHVGYMPNTNSDMPSNGMHAPGLKRKQLYEMSRRRGLSAASDGGRLADLPPHRLPGLGGGVQSEMRLLPLPGKLHLQVLP